MGMQIGFPPGGSGGGSVMPFERIAIAAADTPASMKAGASVVCPGANDQDAINAFLATYSGIVEFLPGTFHVSAASNLRSNTQVRGHGKATVFRAMDAAPADFAVFSNADKAGGNADISVREISFEGNFANQTKVIKAADMAKVTGASFERLNLNEIGGVFVDHSTDVYCDRVAATSLKGSGVYATYVSHITVSTCSFDGGATIVDAENGVYIETFDGAHDIGASVIDCTFRNINVYAWYIAGIDSVKVTGCKTDGVRAYGLYLYQCTRITFTNNNIQGDFSSAVYIDDCSVLNVADNNIVGTITSGDGIYVFGGTDIFVTGNQIRGCGGGITVTGNTANVTGNKVYGGSWHGVYVKQSPGSFVTGNDCRGNGVGDVGTAATISGNICIEASAGCTVVGNIVRKETAPAAYGIWLKGTSTVVVASNNDAYTGGVKGLFADPAATGTVFGAGNRLVDGTWSATAEA